MVGDIATAASFTDLDAELPKAILSRDDVRSPPAAPHAQCQDMRMLEQNQRVRNPRRTAILNKLRLQLQRLAVRQTADATDLKGLQSCRFWQVTPEMRQTFRFLF